MRNLALYAAVAAAVLCTFVGLVGSALALVPPWCRPQIHWHPDGRWELISDACPANDCPDAGGLDCDTFVAGGGYQGCGCPTTEGSCVLMRKLLGGGLIDVICKKYCTGSQNCTEPKKDGSNNAICDPCS